MKMKSLKQSVFLVTLGMICLLLCLIGLDVYPLMNGNDPLIVEQQAWLQVARIEFLAKDVLTLAYRGPTYRSQVISDLQTQLPMLEETQKGLAQGDASLGLPGHLSDTDVLILSRASNDYQPFDLALRTILAHPKNAPDSLVVDAVALHELPFALSMAQLAVSLQKEAEATNLHLVIIKASIKLALIVLIGGFYLMIGRKILTRLTEVEEAAAETTSHATAPLE